MAINGFNNTLYCSLRHDFYVGGQALKNRVEVLQGLYLINVARCL